MSPIPTRLRLLAAVATCALAATVACTSSTAPEERSIIALSELEVPELVMPVDTVRIGYSYVTPCGPAPRTDVVIRPTSVRIVVSAEIPEHTWPCLPDRPVVQGEVFLFPSQRAGVVTVRFRQPGGADSVRTITEMTIGVQ
jgi:hypothetical protein